jgi:hypothetical protein
MQITFTVTNKNPNTIFNKLAAKLGRNPSNAEIKTEVNRILKGN